MSPSNVTSNTASKSNWRRPGARTGRTLIMHYMSFRDVCHITASDHVTLLLTFSPYLCLFMWHRSLKRGISDNVKASYVVPRPIYHSYLFRGFHRTFSTVVACRKGAFTPMDTWSHPIWDLHVFYLLRPILFPNWSLLFRTMHFEHPSVLSRFCFYTCTVNGRLYCVFIKIKQQYYRGMFEIQSPETWQVHERLFSILEHMQVPNWTGPGALFWIYDSRRVFVQGI